MKGQRFRFKLLALFLFGLFLVLALYGGYSVITYGNRWFSSNRNPRVRAQKESVIAGDVLDRNGVVLATTLSDGTRQYQNTEEARRAVVHLLGDSQGQVSNGVETFQTSYLYGFRASFSELAAMLITGEQRRGDDVTLTIDSRLCVQMVRAFNSHMASVGKNGAVVAINYKTGEVLGYVSLPSFDPMNIDRSVKSDPNQPFWNRVTQSLYPPGSTFKTVTSTAAISRIEGVTAQTLNCTGALEVGSQTIHDFGLAVHNDLTLKKAYAISCNNVYALLALTVGNDGMRAAAEAFGFNDNFLFRDMVVENSSYPTGQQSPLHLAASGFGQSSVAATPLHMCLIAAAVANDGVMMEPRLLLHVASPTGRVRERFSSRVYRTAMSPETALILQEYMAAVVNSSAGTGSRARVDRLAVCGKTGTAESTLNGRAVNYAWFIGYIDDPDLPYAVSVLVEDIADGQGGGSVAAPIAADVFAYLRDHPERVR